MKMGWTEFFIGLALGGVGGSSVGYNQRDSELTPVINSLQNQLYVKDQELQSKNRLLREKDQQIASLKHQLSEKNPIPVISQIRKKLEGSQS